jgi:hypothetical protein
LGFFHWTPSLSALLHPEARSRKTQNRRNRKPTASLFHLQEIFKEAVRRKEQHAAEPSVAGRAHLRSNCGGTAEPEVTKTHG